MKGYKAYNKGLICRNKQYKIGEVFEEDRAEACLCGMHYCENPLDCLDYYPLIDSEGNFVEMTEVQDLDNENRKTENNRKFCTKKLKIGAKVSFGEMIKAGFEFLFEKSKEGTGKIDDKDDSQLASSGNYSQLASSGYGSQLASSGNYSQLASSGNYSQLASSGDYSKLASSGYGSKLASSGNYSQLASSGYGSQLASSGDDSKLASSGYYSQLASSGDDSKLASSGYYSKLASSGNYSQLASSGDDSKLASSGYYSQLASSGDDSKLASSGYYSQLASSGNYSKLASSGDDSQLASSGYGSVVANIGNRGLAKAKKGSWIVLAEYTSSGVPINVKVEFVDGIVIKEDTWYMLQDGIFKEAE